MARSVVAALLLGTVMSAPTMAHGADRPVSGAGDPNSVASPALTLEQGFQTPPRDARPWVWWHWMNGNASAEGARLDLEWMKRAGVGGAQMFQGDLFTPQLVDKPANFLSPDWKEDVRAAADAASRLNLGLSIAT
jgi:hypothetical protein